VDPSTGLDGVENTKFVTAAGLELLAFGRPVRSQSLYLLRIPVTSSDINLELISERIGHK
jgi:hypothetical protein